MEGIKFGKSIKFINEDFKTSHNQSRNAANADSKPENLLNGTGKPVGNVGSGRKTACDRILAAKMREYEEARDIMAELALQDSFYIPYFKWAERKLAEIEAEIDTISRARKIVDQKAMKR